MAHYPPLIESPILRMKDLQLPKGFDEVAALKELNPRRTCELGCKVSSPLQDFLVAPKMCECCHAAFYCSLTCQKAHWPAHKPLCGEHGIARQYRGEATWIAAVSWTDRHEHLVWFPLVVHRDDTVDDVKKKIRRRFGVPIDDQVLKARAPMTPAMVEIKMGDSFWRVPGTGTGTLADFENSREEILVLETECAVPRPTCRWCRQCIGGACRLESGPKEEDAPHWRPLQKPPARRNDPCPCGSGRKYKACCGK